jgi:hypothetical protein
MKSLFSYSEAISKHNCLPIELVHEITQGNSITLEQIIRDDRVDLVKTGWFIANECDLTVDELSEFAIGCLKEATESIKITHTSYKYVTGELIPTRAYSYLKYADVTKNDYDRVYASCKAATLLKAENEMYNYFLNFIKSK